MKIIINADDFGWNSQVNRAVVQAFEKGWITNATVMTNFPAFREAVSLAKENGFLDRVALHLNVFDGPPLTQAMAQDPHFAKKGEMTPEKVMGGRGLWRKFFLPKKTVLALRTEARAQMQKYQEAGFSEFHLDSHRHAHTLWSVFRAVEKEALEQGFTSARLSLNLYRKKNVLIRMYKRWFNHRLQKRFLTPCYFTSGEEFLALAKRCWDEKTGKVNWTGFEGKTCEITVHPSFDENGRLIDRLGPDFEELFAYIEKDQLISFRDLPGKDRGLRR